MHWDVALLSTWAPEGNAVGPRWMISFLVRFWLLAGTAPPGCLVPRPKVLEDTVEEFDEEDEGLRSRVNSHFHLLPPGGCWSLLVAALSAKELGGTK